MKRLISALAFLLFATAAFSSVRVLESSANQLLLEFRLDEYELSEVEDMLRVDVAGLDYETRPGAPLLPLEEVRVALPPGGGVSAVLISSSQRQATLSKRLLPVPEVRMNEGLSDHIYKIDESLYNAAGMPLLTTTAGSSFRGVDFSALEIRPFAYDGSFSLTVTDQALIRIDIAGDTSHRSLPQSDELLDLFSSTLLNPGQARQWQNQTRNPVYYADFSRADYWLRLETDREGMFRIGPEQLTGFPLADIDPRSFRLFSNGGKLLPFTIINPGNEFAEIPIRVIGEEDGSFDPADYIVFHGTTRDGTDKNVSLQNSQTYFNPYSGNTVYWLTFAGEFGGDPLRMETMPAQQSWFAETSKFRELTRLETESQRREIIGFDWYMTRMFGNANADYEFELQLPDLDPSTSQALSFTIRQEEVNDSIWHNINVFVNGEPVLADTLGSITFSWRGTGQYLFYKNVSSFVSGQNTVRIRVLRNSTDNLFLNWITVDHTRVITKGSVQNFVNQMALNYEVPVRYNLAGSTDTRVYRVNGLTDVKMVPLQSSAGQNYFVSAGFSDTKYWLSNDSELHSPVNFSLVETPDLALSQSQCDNVIITADEFSAQAQSLADMYLQDHGKRSLVVKQSDIFNQFNGGHPDPAALRQFLRYAWHNYPSPRISSVTLIGLGTIDWRNNSGQAQDKNKLIIYQRNVIASDDYFVMLTQSSHPELAIGRYPVTSSTELANMLSNRENYVRNPQNGWWRNSTVLLGDDLFNGSSTAYENIHTRQTETAGNIIHPSILTDKIFAWGYEYDEFQNKPTARDDMMAAINAGRLIWLYIGHGAYDKLGAEDYFNGASDMGRFNNQDKLPLFMAASCSVSHFDYWGFESLGQKSVLLNNLGAIASYSASRTSAPYSNAPMMEFLLDNLTNGRNPLGQSIMMAKVLFTQSNDNDATYVLLGDPLLNVVPPLRDSLMTVSGQALQGETLHARDLATVSGSFLSSPVNGTAEIKAFNTKTAFEFDGQTHVTHRGAPLFSGSVTVNGGAYQSGFIVPDDVTTGNTGLIVSYLWDPALKQDYTNYHHPLALSDAAVTADNPDAPEIKLYLGSYDFRPGDTVGTQTTLYARISDSNGINVTGSSGHNLLLILDNALQPVPVTDNFSYDLDSHTAGLLTYPLAGLSEGPHTLQVIAFDNFNLPSVASTEFNVKESGELAIERFLIYPNPMQSSTSFTFMLSRDCDLSLDIYSVTGKKIHSFQASGRQGFNAIPWDGRDKRGDRFANNTYFVKLRASADGLKAEATERLVIYK